MASVARSIKRQTEARFRKLKLTRKEDYLLSEIFEESFGNGDKSKNEKRNWRGELSITWIHANIHRFITQVREYQRLKVKTVEWKKTIVQDVLLGGIRVAEVIVRVVEVVNDQGETVFTYQVIDGQQRISAFISYMNDEFTIDVNGKELKYSQLQTEASTVYYDFNNIIFGAQFYENITDAEASIIFMKVNDNTDINAQEHRNSIYGPYSAYIRDRVYYGDNNMTVHRLFERSTITSGKGKGEVLLNFPKLEIKRSRMEQHAWFSELIHWDVMGLRSNVSEATHTEFVESLDPNKEWEGKARAEQLLKIANNLMLNATTNQRENDITPMILSFMTLWYDELTGDQAKFGMWKIPYDKFVTGFLSVIDDYSHTDEADSIRKKNGKRCRNNGPNNKPWTLVGNSETNMGEFKKLFGGKNLKAINTILQILEYELKKDASQFGAIELDPERVFPRKMVLDKLKEQGMVDANNGLPLEFKNAVGAHIIPHSDGIKAGGVTQYHNLKVISKTQNLHEGNKTVLPKAA